MDAISVVIISVVCTLIGTAITVGTVVWSNGRSSGKVQEWMRGHELLDSTRFSSMQKVIEEIQKDVRSLVGR